MRRFILILMIGLPLLATKALAQERVILLHGMCRTKRCMKRMEESLSRAGFLVLNLDYPSRSASIEELSEQAIGKAIATCRKEGASTIHFVTHSLGGILVRSYLARHAIPELGRVVMLGPPNQGSEVVDQLKGLWLFKTLNGPAGQQLGTDAKSVPNKLGPATFSLGVIAGSRSINWINSCMIAGSDDGKVSVERTKVAGMADHIVIATTHPLMMKNRSVIQQTEAFLRHGEFEHRRPTHR
jgi:triacylglycerol lipase